MKSFFLYCIIAPFFCLFTAGAQPAKITWDTWGVPHITANNERDLFFAQGWAQMQAHANLILQFYGKARGKAAAYWGPQFENQDILVHNLGLPQAAVTMSKKQAPELKQILLSFVAGINAYAKTHPEAIDKGNLVVLPVTVDDVNLECLQLFAVNARLLPQLQNSEDIGSNAMAIGPKRSASGHAMLVQNPHLRWSGIFTLFECELNLNGKLMYGATAAGIPGLAIGFNQYLGWTHTDNNLRNADVYDLTLKDGGYLLDGKVLPFTTRNDTIGIKQANGDILKKPLKIYGAIQGAVVKMGKEHALAYKTSGMDCANTMLEWWKMAGSTSFEQFEKALEMQQMPFYNVIYADTKGNIFYLCNGLIPVRKYGKYDDWVWPIDGSSSKNLWDSYVKFSDLPRLKNPASGWLQNANDGAWTVTIPEELDRKKYPAYIATDDMALRPQWAAKTLMADSSITFDRLVSYKLSTHMELADRVLDDLLSGIDSTSSPILQEAKTVLSKWDRKADNDSRGALLFNAWAFAFGPDNDYNFAVRFDPAHPVTTPMGLRDKKYAVQVLEGAAKLVKSAFGDLSVSWGTYYRLKGKGIDLPANGADALMGVYRVAAADHGGLHPVVSAGDSWVGIIEFGNRIKAKVLLSYGNSSQPLFSEKQLRDAWFYPTELKGHIDFTEVKSGNGFAKQTATNH
jgi:acyl-homoserine-lactone acylase